MLNDVSTVVLALELHHRLEQHLYGATPKDDALLTFLDKQYKIVLYNYLSAIVRLENKEE